MENNINKPSIKQRMAKPFKPVINFIGQKPFTAFLIALALFIALIVVSNTLNKPKTTEKKEEKPVTEVDAYYIGTTPKVQVQATLKKSGVITIQAQTAGVVQQIYKKEADSVAKDTNLFWISSTYDGGTLSTAQRQLAETSYNSTKNNLQTNKDAITNQRELAKLNRENFEELRKITERSLDETRGVIETNDAVLNNLVKNIEGSQATLSATPAQIDALKLQQAQIQSGINQLRTANRNAEYQSDTQNPPNLLSDAQLSLTLKQLELQEKSLALQLEVSRINLRIAQIGESLNYPSTPVAGTIERINVITGQLVNPGEILAIIVGTTNSTTAESYVTQSIAQQISRTEPSIITIGKNKIEAMPTYVSTQPTNGSLYSIKYQLSDEDTATIANNSFTTIEIPVGATDTNGTIPFIPIDAVYQTQDGAYVYVAKKQDDQTEAMTKKIILGEIIGSFVQVESGLITSDIVILNRNVIEGDLVKVKEQGLK